MSRNARFRLFLVDDHPLVRLGIRRVLGREAELDIVGEAGSPSEALNLLGEVHPDLVITGLRFPEGGGLRSIRELRTRDPRARVLVFSDQDEALFAERSLLAGAAGYLHKTAPIPELLQAVHNVLAGRIALSSQMTGQVLLHAIRLDEPGRHSLADRLTRREQEVLGFLGEGLNIQQIGAALEISPKTVECYRDKLKTKLQARHSADLLRHAVQWAHEPEEVFA